MCEPNAAAVMPKLSDPEIASEQQQTLQAVGASQKRWEDGFMNGVKGRVINFTPSWFSVIMGTGITSIILHNLPYQFRGLPTIAAIVFVLNTVLFITFTLVTIIRYVIWRGIWTLMINNNVQSLFWGTFSMGFSTVVDGVVLFAVPAFGERYIYLAWGLWWINSVISLIVGIGLPFIMFTRHTNEVSKVTGVWLLPVVSPIVTAAAGGIVAMVLPPAHARLTIIISYMLLGAGLAPALLIQALYLQRLAIYKLPPSATIVSCFLPIGPCGQSAYALVQLAVALRRIQSLDGRGLGGTLSVVDNNTIVLAIYALSFVGAFFMMGLGFFWLAIAIMSNVDLATKGHLSFNIGFWGYTFPLGTMATASIIISRELDSRALKVLAMILSTAVILLWLFVAVRTSIQVVSGKVFVAPCLGAAGQAPKKVHRLKKGTVVPSCDGSGKV